MNQRSNANELITVNQQFLVPKSWSQMVHPTKHQWSAGAKEGSHVIPSKQHYMEET